MITNVEISNYRSIGDKVSLKLGRLTALVGPNGSGKSHVIDALRFVADALRHGLDAAITNRQGFAAIRRRSASRSALVAIQSDLSRGIQEHGTYLFALGANRPYGYQVKQEEGQWTFCGESDGKPSYSLWFRRSGDLIINNIHFANNEHAGSDSLALATVLDTDFPGLYEGLKDVAVYSIHPDTLRQPQKLDPTTPMREHGENWCSILKSLKHEASESELVAALGKVTGDISGLRVRRVGGYLVTEFRHSEGNNGKGNRKGPQWYDAGQESDGTLRLAGILTALLQEPPPALIAVEEPELTIHPGAIPLLYDYLKEASTRSQVLFTTHSPELLSLLDADEIRVVERREGVTTVSPMDESQREAVRDRLLTLGDLIRMEGLRPASPRETAEAGG